MNHRLVYVVGPSGAGKDSLLHWLVQHPPAHTDIQLARRTVTRPSMAGVEGDEAVDTTAFAELLRAQAFALHWSANGLHYGIRRHELAALTTGAWVLVSGSRAHLPVAQQHYPGLSAIHLQASTEVLRERLAARRRESGAEVEARLQRAVAFAPPAGAFCITNDDDLASAGRQLKAHLFPAAALQPG